MKKRLCTLFLAASILFQLGVPAFAALPTLAVVPPSSEQTSITEPTATPEPTTVPPLPEREEGSDHWDHYDLSKGGNRISESEFYAAQSPVAYTNINNLVVFVSFADSAEYLTAERFAYANTNYNTVSAANASVTNGTLKDVTARLSYNKLTVNSVFCSTSNTQSIKLSRNKGYYMPYSSTNLEGYQSSTQRWERENELVRTASDAMPTLLAENCNLDDDKNGVVDSISFVFPVSLSTEVSWGDLL